MASRPPQRRRRISKKELKRRRRKAYIARFILFLASVMFAALLFLGVRAIVRALKSKAGDTAQKAVNSSLEAGSGEEQGLEEDRTLIFNKNGSIVETIVEAFDEENYSSEDLKAMVENEILEYNSSAKEDSIELEDLKFGKGEAELSIKYASDTDYDGFNGYDIKFRKISDMGAFKFTEAVTAVQGGESVAAAEISNIKGTIVILNLDAHVKLPKKIKYVSSGIEVTGKKEAEVKEGNTDSYIIYWFTRRRVTI